MNLTPRTESRLNEIVAGELERRRRGEDLPPEVRAALGDPARCTAELALVAPLGKGGAGEVWKAWDRSLHRWVAVKVPADAPDPERFRNEALAAARLAHPNIVPIHRATDFRGKPCIVMALVEGRTLAEGRLPAREALEAVRVAALAVHYAHQRGVVHRDLKPGNLMLDERGGVWVLDFGLAYLAESGGRARAGGTPAFMSPEQARGAPEAREPATDVYSLGATLYALLTGRPPFEGSSFTEVAPRVIQGEPPRAPGLDPGVEAVVLRAMRKDPRLRHGSAGELAEDLARLLVRRRRPLAWAAWAAAVVVAAAAAVGAFRPRRDSGLEAVRKVARMALDAALEFRRVGSNDKMRAYFPDLEAAYREAVDRAPGLAEVEYLMGRMHRALMEDERALECQERALRKDPRYAPALYERAVLSSRKYRRELRRAHEAARALEGGGITAREARQVPLQSLEQVEQSRPDLVALRERVVRDVRELGRSPGISPTSVLIARAILDYHVGQYAEARDLLAGLAEREPLPEEAWETLARAAHLRMAEGPEELERRWAEAERWYGEGIARDRGYLPHWFGRSDLRRERANYRMKHGDDPLPDYRGAEEDLSRAVALDRGSGDAWTRRGIIRATRSIYLMNRGADPGPDQAAALEDFAEALRLQPGNSEAAARVGFVRSHRGIHAMALGGDPGEDFARAEEDFARAERMDPSMAGLWMWRGHMRTHRGMFRAGRGEEPWGDYARAERDLTQAIRLDRQYAAAWKNRGYVRTHRGIARLARGEDPQADFAEAEEDFSETIRLDRDYAMAWKNRGFMRTHRGGARGDLAELEASVEDFTRAIELDGGHAEAWAQRAAARDRLGRLREAAGERPAAAGDYAAAAADCRAAARHNPLLAGTAEAEAARLERRAAELRGR